MKENELTVYIAAHKPCSFIKNEYYCPIQVNAKKNKHFLPVTDDVGNNISEKNDRFCELTALYWIWKNDHHSKYVGLCHYRRYFKMNFGIWNWRKIQYEQKCITNNDTMISDNIIKYLEKGYIILPKPQKFDKMNVQEHYSTYHDGLDLRILKETTLKKYPQYTKAWDAVFNGHKLYTFNMFIMRRNYFDDYMKWLFTILFNVETKILPKVDPYQNRVFGFMSERLFNVFLFYKQYKVKELPVIFLK